MDVGCDSSVVTHTRSISRLLIVEAPWQAMSLAFDTNAEFLRRELFVSREAESCCSPGVDRRHYAPGLQIVKSPIKKYFSSSSLNGRTQSEIRLSIGKLQLVGNPTEPRKIIFLEISAGLDYPLVNNSWSSPQFGKFSMRAASASRIRRLLLACARPSDSGRIYETPPIRTIPAG
jgi:hypothetical protein